MPSIKDTVRAQVRIDYSGRVLKNFRGHQAKERFENEILVLKYLEKKECPFVPRVLETDPNEFLLVTSYCGKPVEYMSKSKEESLFKELEDFGVRHDDQALRNITYSIHEGRFFIIDFEFAQLLNDPNHHPPSQMPPEKTA